MVLRKNTPSGDLVPAPLSQATNNPPYPTTPLSEHPPQLPTSGPQEVYSPDLATSPAFDLRPLEEAQKKREEDSESDYSDNEWEHSDDDTPPNDLPGALKIGGGKPIPVPANKNALPDALRAGPPPGMAIKRSQEAISPEPTGTTSSSFGAASNISSGSAPLHTNNPYLKMQTTGQSGFGAESSQQVWGESPSQAPTYGELVELPGVQTPHSPTNHMADLQLDTDPSSHRAPPPEQPPLIAVESATPHSSHPRHESNASEDYAPGMDISSLDAFARNYGLPQEPREEDVPQRTWQEQQAWERSERERKQRELEAAHEAAVKAEQERHHEDEFYRMEQSSQFPPQPSHLPPQVPQFPPPLAPQFSAPPPPPSFQAPPLQEEEAPALPPRRSHEEHAPPMPPRPLDTGIVGSANAGPESPNTAMNRQRKEHYQIKHIRWHDVNKRGIRTSPILTQNLNGPCPLLALVNALVLSTPSGIETALVETLRTREQVSLGLLLDAVFDELMSGRRGGAAQELPDVSELYKFLLALHTGLNVNPMFVQDPDSTDGTSTSVPLLADRPGGFENTRDMRLYRTFNIPLVHGWLPEPGSDAYRSFERIAKSYELSQYVQFQEEELDAKLQTDEALTADEQQMFTDIHAIKEYLTQWPTQLSHYGLKTIRESLQPGQVAILFRNDHFSTLCKDPRTNKLVTLVTDQGYSSHDEIVWESLVDVNGQGSELFSGDFRPVGNESAPVSQQEEPPIRSLLDVDNNQEWTAVQSRRVNQPSSSSGNAPSGVNASTAASQPPGSDFGKVEQEDHDLALALQLQEEEDDRHRRSVEERRRRENEMSESTIAAQSTARPANSRTSRPGEQLPPLIPPRRNNQQTHRPPSEPAPPPTYEEASTARPYNPPQGHPSSMQAPLRAQGSAYRMNAQGGPSPNQAHMPQGRRNSRPLPGAPLPARPGRRQSTGMVGPNQHEEREKCVVM